MNHIDFFIHQLEVEKKAIYLKVQGVRGRKGGWVRPIAFYIVWKYNGLSVINTAKIFGLSRVNIHLSVLRYDGYHEKKDELFMQRYNEILTFYIKTTKAYLKRNNIYNLKNVA